MKNSKLLALLRTFSPAEWKSFGKYLRSPYHNANQRLVRFFGFLKKYHPAFEHPNMAKPKTFEKIYPEKAEFDDRLMRALMAEMHKAGERFLQFEQFNSDERLRDKMLVRAYGERGLYRRFEQKSMKIICTINEQTNKNEVDYHDAYELNRNLYFHPQTKALTATPITLLNAVKQLDNFYAFAKLRLSCELSARSNIIAEKVHYPLLNSICDFVENGELKDKPIFAIYLELLGINLNGLNEKSFFKLKNKFVKSSHCLSSSKQKEILIYLLNYAYRLGQKNQNLFFEQQFELYKIGLENKLMFDKGMFPDLTFTNIAIIGALLKKWDWTLAFVKEYETKLPEGVRLEAVNLAKAYLLFHQGKFNDADSLLNTVVANKIEYRLRHYSLSIRCLYEISINDKSYYKLLDAKIEAYEKYLTRQKIFSKNRALSEINLIKIIKKMALIYHEKKAKKTEWNNLLLEIKNTNPIAARRWLITKVSRYVQRAF